MHPFLSLCMIVRDESDTIDRCLRSIVHLVDEIVIVDTGSSDDTRELALAYTPHLINWKWTQDFAAARNASIAQSAGEWILVLDADEYLEIDDTAAARLREHLRTLPAGSIAISLPIYNFVGSASSGSISHSSALRLFRRHPDLRFERPIHEQLRSQSGNMIQLEYDLPIYHTGYTSESIARKQKSQRNESIFKKMRASGRLTPYDAFTLGNEHFAQDRYDEALSCYLEADQPSERDKTWLPQCYANIISCQMKLRLYTDAYDRINQSLLRWGRSCDFYWFKGHLLSRLGLEEEAIDALNVCLAKADAVGGEPGWMISPNYGSTLPLQQLAALYLQRFDAERASSTLTKLLYANPNLHSALFELLRLLAPAESESRIGGLLAKLYPAPEPYQAEMIADCCAQFGLSELTADYRSKTNASFESPNSTLTLLRCALAVSDPDSFIHAARNLMTAGDQPDASFPLRLAGSAIWPSMRDDLLCESDMEHTQHPPSVAAACLILYRLKRFDEYDRLMKAYEDLTLALANLLGDALFEERNYELAFDYYGTTLDQGALEARGAENIARLYIHQGDVAGALPFLEEALRLDPGRIPLYFLYFKHQPVEDIRAVYASRLTEYEPGLQGFPHIVT